MAQGFLQVIGRIEVVLKKKLHGSFSGCTALTHIVKHGRNKPNAKGNYFPFPLDKPHATRQLPPVSVERMR
jgi:hypothetical protein